MPKILSSWLLRIAYKFSWQLSDDHLLSEKGYFCLYAHHWTKIMLSKIKQSRPRIYRNVVHNAKIEGFQHPVFISMKCDSEVDNKTGVGMVLFPIMSAVVVTNPMNPSAISFRAIQFAPNFFEDLTHVSGTCIFFLSLSPQSCFWCQICKKQGIASV